MLVGGYLGEAGYMNYWIAFAIGMAGWIYILYLIFFGVGAGRVVVDPPDGFLDRSGEDGPSDRSDEDG
jgi:hypothetical protein